MSLAALHSNLLARDDGEWVGNLVFGPGGQFKVVDGAESDQNPMKGGATGARTASDDHQASVSPSPSTTAASSTPPAYSSTTPPVNPSTRSSISSPLASVNSAAPTKTSSSGESQSHDVYSTSTISPTSNPLVTSTSLSYIVSTQTAAPITFTLSLTSAQVTAPSPSTTPNKIPESSSAASVSSVSNETSSTAAASPTLVQTPAPTKSQSSDASRNAQIYAGIALGVVAGLALLAALIAWFIRIRSRRKLDCTRWSWSPFGPASEDEDHAAGFMWSRTNPYGNTKHYSSDGRTDGSLSSPSGRSPITSELPSLENPFADPPRAACAPDGPSGIQHLSNPGGGAWSGLPDSLSLPSLRPPDAAFLGPLQVTNMMPGDHYPSSGEETTPRLPSDGVLIGSAFGTPREDPGSAMPRYHGVDGHGLSTPGLARGTSARAVSDSRGGGAPLPSFGLPEPTAPAPTQLEAQDPSTPGTATWAASIRANLTSALAAVANRKFLTLPAAAGATDDRLTPLPTRGGSRRYRIRDVEWQEEKSPSDDVEKEKGEDDGKNVTLGSGDIAHLVPTLAYDAPDGLSEDSCSLSCSDTYDSREGVEKAPRLPSIIPISRGMSVASDSSGEEQAREGAAKALEHIRERAATRAARPELRVRTSSLLSCASSDAEERLTDDERRARRMLLERRKRNMASAVSPISPGRGRGLGSTRSSMKSVRRAGVGRGKMYT